MRGLFEIAILTASLLSTGLSDSALAATTSTLSASSRAEFRASMRGMPLLNRPYRPGHIYGNTVRFMNRLRGG